MPLTRSVMYDDEAMADPQPKVLNLTSEMTPCSSTRIWSFITLAKKSAWGFGRREWENKGVGDAIAEQGGLARVTSW